jgi:hypothetical protein
MALLLLAVNLALSLIVPLVLSKILVQINNHPSATLNNSGLFANIGTINNDGLVNVYYCELFVSGTLTNNATLNGCLVISRTGIVHNYGLLDNYDGIDNSGTLYNHCEGVITNPVMGNRVIEVNDCNNPTPTPTPSPEVEVCEEFPKYGLALISTQQMSYSEPGGEPARDGSGNPKIWLGLFIGGCNAVYVPLDQVAPLNWLPLP